MLKSLGIWNVVISIDRRHRNPNYSILYRLTIWGNYINVFNKLIGFNNKHKEVSVNRKHSNKTIYNSYKITSIEKLDRRELIDITINEEEHLFLANGIAVSNCHRISADTYLKILNNIPAKYRVGFTATVKRKDQKEILIFDVLGSILEDIKGKSLQHRLMSFDFEMINTNISMEMPTIYRWPGKKKENVLDMTKSITLLTEDSERNKLIVSKIIESIEQGYYPLIISDRVAHNRFLHRRLTDAGYKCLLLIGATRKDYDWKDVRKDSSIQAIVATSSIASEGLNLPELSALFLTCPSTNLPKIKQRTGRIRRRIKGKKKPKVFDFVDNLVFLTENETQKYLLLYSSYKRAKYYRELQEEYE